LIQRFTKEILHQAKLQSVTSRMGRGPEGGRNLPKMKFEHMKGPLFVCAGLTGLSIGVFLVELLVNYNITSKK
jgi:hypothetical protein